MQLAGKCQLLASEMDDIGPEHLAPVEVNQRNQWNLIHSRVSEVAVPLR